MMGNSKKQNYIAGEDKKSCEKKPRQTVGDSPLTMRVGRLALVAFRQQQKKWRGRGHGDGGHT